HIAVQLRVARFVNRPHSAGPKGLAQLEMIKRARDPYSFATSRTGHARERLGIADIYWRIARGTRNGVRVAHFCDSNIVNDTGKPPGISVHPGAGRKRGTLVNALLSHCRNLSGIGGKERPGIVHRLDKETSGCLAVAKNDFAHLQLSRQFAARTVEKIYLALVAGKVRRVSGTIVAPIARHRVH